MWDIMVVSYITQPLIHPHKVVHVIIITHPRGLYPICKHDAQGWSIYKSDTNWMDVLQLLCFMVNERPESAYKLVSGMKNYFI